MKKALLLSFVLLLTTFSRSTATPGLAYEENPTIPTRVISTEPSLRWEDAMLSGNGSTDIMVLVGKPRLWLHLPRSLTGCFEGAVLLLYILRNIFGTRNYTD